MDAEVKRRRWLQAGFVLGVLALWILSALGGFGGESYLSYGWGVLILPYPVGWMMLLILFYLRLFAQKKSVK